MSIDPEHVEAVMSVLEQTSVSDDAYALLTSTDPDVHAALLAALVRTGVLTEVTISRRACGCRAESFAAMCCRQSSDTPNTTERRYVTRWEETCD